MESQFDWTFFLEARNTTVTFENQKKFEDRTIFMSLYHDSNWKEKKRKEKKKLYVEFFKCNYVYRKIS